MGVQGRSIHGQGLDQSLGQAQAVPDHMMVMTMLFAIGEKTTGY